MKNGNVLDKVVDGRVFYVSENGARSFCTYIGTDLEMQRVVLRDRYTNQLIDATEKSLERPSPEYMKQFRK